MYLIIYLFFKKNFNSVSHTQQSQPEFVVTVLATVVEDFVLVLFSFSSFLYQWIQTLFYFNF